MNDKRIKNTLSNEELTKAIASSISIVYGVTSLISKKSINNKSDIPSLPSDKLSDGIIVKKRGSKYNILVYVAISKDVKKEEVESQLSTQIIYDLSKKFKLSSKDIVVTPYSIVK